MNWLLWKDYRHNRLIVLATLVLLVTPYLIGVAVIVGGRWIQDGTRDGQPVYWTPPWREIVAGTGGYSFMLCQLGLALLGGNAISGERVDRSSQFLYSLPVTRRKLLASKLLFVSLVTAMICLVNMAVFLFLVSVTREVDERFYEMVFTVAAYIAATGLTFFCVAWCLSSFVASPAIDVCGGIIAPALVGSGIYLGSELLHLRVDGDVLWRCYLITCLILAPLSFATGTWFFLRRVEP